MRLASSRVAYRLKTFGRRGIARLGRGEPKSAIGLGFLRRPGRFVTLTASVTAMGLTVGMAVAGNRAPLGSEARKVVCDSAPAALDVGCGEAQPAEPGTDGGQPAAPEPSSPVPGGLTVTEDRPAILGTGSATGDDDGHGNGNPGGDGKGDGDGDGDEDGDGDGEGNGDGDEDDDGDDDEDGDGDDAPTLTAGRPEPLFSLPNLAAGKRIERCIAVTYEGDVPATISLYATRGGTGLDAFLDLDVVRGQMPSSTNGTCTGFVPDAENLAGVGPGVLYDGRLAEFPSGAAPSVTPSGPPWQDGDTHAYKIALSLASQAAAEGLSVQFDLVWKAET